MKRQTMSPLILQLILMAIVNLSTNRVQCISNFSFDLKPNQRQCFQEYIVTDTIVKIDITQEITSSDVELKLPGNNHFVKTHNAKNFSKSFKAEKTGELEVCVSHRAKKVSNVDFSLLFGLAANDFEAIAKLENFKPLETHVVLFI